MSDVPPRPSGVSDVAAPAIAKATPRATIGSRLTSRENNFDFIRLVAAFLVIVSHSWPLRDGDSNGSEPYFRLSGYCSLGEMSVATFFVISGLLVARSYLVDPSPTAFLRKRFLRILPALVVCVAFCIFIVGPLFTQLGLRDYFLNKATFRFSRNAILYPSHYFELPGVFNQYHDDRQAVNGSLWSLPLEFFMYLGVLGLGAVGLLSRRWCLILISAALLLQWVAVERILHTSAEWQDAHRRFFDFIDKYQVWLDNLAQLGFLFFAGALMLLYKDSIALDWRIFVGCLLLVAIGWQRPFGYFLFIVCLPYIVMYLAFVPARALQSVTKRGDFSYGVYLYGYPVQQMLMRTLNGKLPFAVIIGLSCLGTLMLAVVSWHWVEKPFLKLKRRSSRGSGTVPLVDVTPEAQVSQVAPVSLERQLPLVDIH